MGGRDHILLPKSCDVALALKQQIRNKVTSSLVTIEDSDDAAEAKVRRPAYIANAFLAAAKKYSCDEGTAYEGGLLGTLVPQGYCQAPELDRACFEVPLGEICGPIESEYGYHLLLVVECTNCKAIDGEFTKIVRGDDGNSKKFATGDGFDSRGFATDDGFDSRGSLSHLATQQIRFWVGVSLAGGIVANISAKAANVVDQHLE